MYFFNIQGGNLSVPFVDIFDENLATNGPPALFTINHEGFLSFDLLRTRSLWVLNEPPYDLKDCHCMLIDKKTGWPQYALITSANLTKKHPSFELTPFPSQENAINAVASRKLSLFASNQK
jgi:hypothetical protein